MPQIRLLDASVDDQTESDLRILVDHKHIKYLTVQAGVSDNDTMCFEPDLIAALPPLPSIEWKRGVISRNLVDGTPYFSSVSNDPLPGVTNLWHPNHIDYLDLQLGQKLRSNAREATCPRLPGKVVVKLARFGWEIWQLEQETQAYEWIEGHNIGPAFLAHLTEEGRVMGFVMEHVAEARHAELQDLQLCRQTVQKLHRLGIKHGDVNKHNMLVRNGAVTLIDFDGAVKCQDSEELNDELQSLESELGDMSGRGGTIVE